MNLPILSVAPMVDWSDRHFRFFLRQLAPKSLFYTEMNSTGAVLNGNEEHILGFDSREKPLALQIAGDDPADLVRSIKKAEAWDYDEYNFNCGCPSDKVLEAHFGACLMAEPHLVARLVEAMKAATNKPVTVKHRIGIDGLEDYEDMVRFVRAVGSSGADRLIIHARIAILTGLDPKENREIPPLRYPEIWRLKQEFPSLVIEINGGIRTLENISEQLTHVDGVMIGRAAYEDPYFMNVAENLIWNVERVSRRQVLENMMGYFDEWEAKGLGAQKIFHHMTSLFAGFPGARRWRRLLSPPYKTWKHASDILREGITMIPDWVLDSLELRPTGRSIDEQPIEARGLVSELV